MSEAPETRPEQPLPEPPVTGDALVDAAVQELAQGVRAPLEQQVGAFDRMHRTLQDRLADADR